MPTTEITGTRLDWQTFQSIVPEMATSMAAVTHAMLVAISGTID